MHHTGKPSPDCPDRYGRHFCRWPELFAGLACVLPLWALAACHSEEVCDWKDNDGDGIIDEGFDADGDGWWACGVTEAEFNAGEYDCDDSDPSINPDAVDACDGIDNDCDGVVDAGCGVLQAEYPGQIADVEVTDWDGDGWRDILIFSSVGEDDDSNGVVTYLLNRGTGSDGLVMENSGQFVFPSDWFFWSLTPIPDGNTTVPRALSGIAISGLVTLVASPDGTITIDELYDVWPVLVGSSVHRYADVDGDDSMEIVVAGSEFFASPPNSWLDTLEPDDDQGWLLASETPLAEGTGPSGLEVIDVDGDGILDAVVAQSSVISWYRGTGDGGFTLAGTADVDESIVNLVTRDFDSDGRAEVVVSVPSQWRIWYLDDVNGIPLAARRKIDVYRHPYAVAAGDVDGDGDQDLVVTSRDEPSLSVLANDGTGAFAVACQRATGWDPWIVSAAALDEPVGQPATDDIVVVNLEDNSLMTFVGACDDIDAGTAP